MIWIATQRKVVLHLNKMRWHVPKERLKPPYTTTGRDYNRWDNGIERREFEYYLMMHPFTENAVLRWLNKIYLWLRPRYAVVFHHKLNGILKECIRDGYIHQENGWLSVTEKGKKLAAWYYPFRLFFGNAYVKAIIISVITLATTYYVANMLRIPQQF